VSQIYLLAYLHVSLTGNISVDFNRLQNQQFCLGVTGGSSVGECDRLSWFLVRTVI